MPSLPSNTQQSDTLKGANLKKLAEHIGTLTRHSAECGGDMHINGETLHHGLACILEAECHKCKQKFHLENDVKVKGPTGRMRWSMNLEAVWGQIGVGGGPTALNESLAALNVPGMSEKCFITIESQIGKLLRKELGAQMMQEEDADLTDEAMESARLAVYTAKDPSPTAHMEEILTGIMKIASTVAEKAPKIIHNHTSNLAHGHTSKDGRWEKSK